MPGRAITTSKASLRSGVTVLDPVATPPAPTSAPTSEQLRHCAVARYLWAMLTCVYETFSLLRPICHSTMRQVRKQDKRRLVGAGS